MERKKKVFYRIVQKKRGGGGKRFIKRCEVDCKKVVYYPFLSVCESAEERCILVLYEIKKKGEEEGEGEKGVGGKKQRCKY